MLSSADMLRLSSKVRTTEETAAAQVLEETQAVVKAEAESGETQAHIEVPAIISGLPAYDYHDVCARVKAEYLRGGFQVSVHALGQYTIHWSQPASSGGSSRHSDTDDTRSEVVRVVYT